MENVIEFSAKPSQPSRKWSQILPACISTIGAFSMGTVMEWSAPALPQLDIAYCGNHCDIALTGSQMSWVASIVYLGAMMVGPLAGYLMVKFGHKWTMIILCVPFIIGWVCILLAYSAPLLYIGRFLTGFAGGAFSMLAPVYTSEICETKIRGALGSLQSLNFCIGIIMVSVVGKFVPVDYLSGVCLFFPILFAILMFFMPQSPVYLVSNGKLEDAKKSLLFLRGPNFDADNKVMKIRKTLEETNSEGPVGVVTMLTTREYLVPLLFCSAIFSVQQLSGINAIGAYKVEIFEDAGSSLDPYIANIVISLTQAAFTCVAIALVDKCGRKILLITSSFFMSGSLVVLGVFFYLKHYSTSSNPPVSPETVQNLSILPLVTLFVFYAAFTIGFGPLPWLINSEMFPKEAKATASALNTSICWFLSFLVVKFYSAAEEVFYTHNTYFFFAAVCLLGGLFVLVLVPETKGKTEEDMKRYFQKAKVPERDEESTTPQI